MWLIPVTRSMRSLRERTELGDAGEGSDHALKAPAGIDQLRHPAGIVRISSQRASQDFVGGHGREHDDDVIRGELQVPDVAPLAFPPELLAPTRRQVFRMLSRLL
jgi:hypothetical protein